MKKFGICFYIPGNTDYVVNGSTAKLRIVKNGVKYNIGQRKYYDTFEEAMSVAKEWQMLIDTSNTEYKWRCVVADIEQLNNIVFTENTPIVAQSIEQNKIAGVTDTVEDVIKEFNKEKGLNRIWGMNREMIESFNFITIL